MTCYELISAGVSHNQWCESVMAASWICSASEGDVNLVSAASQYTMTGRCKFCTLRFVIMSPPQLYICFMIYVPPDTKFTTRYEHQLIVQVITTIVPTHDTVMVRWQACEV